MFAMSTPNKGRVGSTATDQDLAKVFTCQFRGLQASDFGGEPQCAIDSFPKFFGDLMVLDKFPSEGKLRRAITTALPDLLKHAVAMSKSLKGVLNYINAAAKRVTSGRGRPRVF
jgi:hypothetical protein